MTCGPCQDLLLDYLFGLLDEAETEYLRSHLDDCPGCTAALQRATQEKTAIAHAARAVSDVPEFRVPGSTSTAITAVASPLPTADVPTPRRRSFRGLHWIITSALAAGVVMVGYLNYRHHEQVENVRLQLASIDREIAKFEIKEVAQDKEFFQRRQDMPQELARQAVQMTVNGSNRDVAGVTAPVQIALTKVTGEPARGTVKVEVCDAHDKAIASRRVDVNGWAAISPAELANGHIGPANFKFRFAEESQPPAVIEESIRLAPKSYAAHLALNKNLYRPGESVLVRALFVDRHTLKIPDGPIQASVTLTDETGPKVTQPLAFVKGMAAAGMLLPVTLPPGVYTVRLNAEELAPVTRTIEVLAPNQPTADIVTQSTPYRGGDRANFAVQLYYGNGDPVANSEVTGNYTINNRLEQQDQRINGRGGAQMNGIQNPGQNQAQPGFRAINDPNFNQFGNQTGAINGRTNDKGQIEMNVDLPKDAPANRYYLNLDVNVGRRKVEASTAFRVVPTNLSVELHPEGGRLIEGVRNKVYYRVRTPLGETVAPEGQVVVQTPTAVLHRSEREQSAGVFELVPDSKEKYQVRVTAPTQAPTQAPAQKELADPFANLGIRTDGVLVHGDGVQKDDQPIRLDLENVGRGRLLQVITTCRGEIVDHQRFRQDPGVGGRKDVELAKVPAADADKDGELKFVVDAPKPTKPWRKDVAGRRIEIASKLDGIHRVSVFEVEDSGSMSLLAERLVYRQPTRRLDIGATLSPFGDRVEFLVAGKDESGRPTPFYGLASVVDDRFVTEQPEPTLTDQFLVLEDANADFVDQPLLVRPAGLDLALGILGWRAPSQAHEAVARAEAKRADDLAANHAKLAAKPALEKLAEAKDPKDGRNEGIRQVAEPNDAVRQAETATFFWRVQPTPAELRHRIDDLALVAARGLERRDSKERQVLADERSEAIRQRAAAQAELRALEEQPREAAMLTLGVLTLGSLVVGTVALLWGFARLVRGGSSTASFSVAFVGIAACLMLLLFQPQDELGKGQFAARQDGRGAMKQPQERNRPDNAALADQLSTNDGRVALGLAPAEEAAPAANVLFDGQAAAQGGGLGGGAIPNGGRALVVRQEQADELREKKDASKSEVLSKRFAYLQRKQFADSESRKDVRGGANGPAAGGGAPGAALPAAKLKDKNAGFTAPASTPAAPGTVPPIMATTPKSAPTKLIAPAPLPPGPPSPAALAGPDVPGPVVSAPAAAQISPEAPKEASFGSGVSARMARDAKGERESKEALDQFLRKASEMSPAGAVDVVRARNEFEFRQSVDLATLLWNPVWQVPAAGAPLSFDVPAGTAKYRILILGHTDDSRFGCFEDRLVVGPAPAPAAAPPTAPPAPGNAK